MQNENFLQKKGILIEKLHFLAKLFGYVKKKSYLCMLFRGDVSLARVYTGARNLRRETAEAVLKEDREMAEAVLKTGKRDGKAGGKHGNI
ncbi:MAG: hypothetical protein ACI4TV_00490 [Paludibacteraceae bacterium]